MHELPASASSIQIQGKRLPDGLPALSGVEAPPQSKKVNDALYPRSVSDRPRYLKFLHG